VCFVHNYLFKMWYLSFYGALLQSTTILRQNYK